MVLCHVCFVCLFVCLLACLLVSFFLVLVGSIFAQHHQPKEAFEKMFLCKKVMFLVSQGE